jgi:hypothetical protein
MEGKLCRSLDSWLAFMTVSFLAAPGRASPECASPWGGRFTLKKSRFKQPATKYPELTIDYIAFEAN